MALSHGVKVLTDKQMYDVHWHVLRVLSEVGVELFVSDDALERIAARGLKVDKAAHRVWLTEESVLETIRQLSGARSSEVTVYGVDKEPLPHVLPARLSYGFGATFGFVLDSDGREMRAVRREDMLDALRLQKHLTGAEPTGCGLLTQEVPGPVAYVHTSAFNAKYCRQPQATDCDEPRDAQWITRIMRAAGAWDETQEHRGSIYARSPLCLTGRGAEWLEKAARDGHPARATGMPTSGATAPGTVAGYLVSYLAESLGFATLGRLIATPPNDVLSPSEWGDDITAMDMRQGIYFLAGPEVSLMRMGMKQMLGEFYKMPGGHCCGVRIYTEAKVPGIQAGMEKTFQALCDLMVGMRSEAPEPVAWLGCGGALNCNLSLSFEQAVLDFELCGMLNRLLAGIRADKDAIGLNAYKRVGPSGEFLSDEHTLRYVQSEWWFPSLMHRGGWNQWNAEGRPSMLDRAREVVEASKGVQIELAVDEDTAREIDRLVQEAERDLLGTTTGVLP